YAIAVADGPVARVYTTAAAPVEADRVAGRAPEEEGAWPIAYRTYGAAISPDGRWAANPDHGTKTDPNHGTLRAIADGKRGSLVSALAPVVDRRAVWLGTDRVATVVGSQEKLCLLAVPDGVHDGPAQLPAPEETCAPPLSGADANLFVADPDRTRVA